MFNKWYEESYHRNVIDMHITDHDDSFLSEFDSKKYVEMLTLSKAESAVLYAHSHVGLCYYPTRYGEMHRGLNGRNILEEIIKLCHEKNIKVVVYYSLIYDSWAYLNNPDWRIIDAGGKEFAEKSRFGVCCPNSGYRDFVVKRVEEICSNYDFEGLRFDMTFWPGVCYCRHCRERFAKEVGEQLPVVVNWNDPVWVAFQRARERWLVDFAALATSIVRKIKPGISVEHQSSTYIAPWQFGVTTDLSKQSDFMQGDFYGGYVQGSFACKLFYNLSENLPFGFETCSNVNLYDHTTLKSQELLESKVCMSLANGGAFVFIDAIDPVGTLNEKVYATMGGIFKRTQAFEGFLGGKMCQDVAVYLSTESKFDFEDNGKNVLDASDKIPHVDAALGAATALINHHIPFGVVTKKSIQCLSQYQAVILPNILMMDDEEVEAVKEYVKSGGCIYASRFTSLVTKDGIRKEDFMLGDVLGISCIGETKENFTFIAPTDEGNDVFSSYSKKYPLSIYGPQMLVRAEKEATVLGTTVLPYTDPQDYKHYASIHSNPPGILTDNAAVILNTYGKGKAIYVAGDLENMQIHHDEFIKLLKKLGVKSFALESDAPKAMEITVFHQENNMRYIISFLNIQKELPNIPVEGVKIRMSVDNKEIEKVVVLPDEVNLNFEIKEGYVEFNVPQIKTFAMAVIKYGSEDGTM